MDLRISRRRLKGGGVVSPATSLTFQVNEITVAIHNRYPDRPLYYRIIP